MELKTIKTLKEIPREEQFAPGHRLCAGCGIPQVVRLALKAVPDPKVVVNATGCLEVATTIFPYTSWGVPWVHIAFENAAAVASGIEAAFKILSKKYGVEKPKIIVFGGDGGTFDIGFQALSGALERGHDMIYICYDNEAYMNTGIQRSGATPKGASTTTSPAGKVVPGKLERKKNLIEIAIAHGIRYAATMNPAFPVDMYNKIVKAANTPGPTVLHYFTPCPTGWYFDPSRSIEVARLAVQTRIWPLYEYDNGKIRITVPVKEPRPVEDYFKLQGRFRHLLEPENKWLLEEIKRDIEENWQKLMRMAEQSK
ncbi:thiamine pyrophosphate-dependent enzyme [Thermofilum pendens]|uniref:2-oxoacid oxidoreductase (ferredoxin) n=1 Tax=Thermofilum pendens (strain DSM 2475 / Hrk 5) TaxID=368408 RepID=A1RXP9_THEPD|nr:thiamine pyrophosphate-dependent enzyme [Thermofilum pendens]ABL77979.1 pyruvate ferredoxin oxidoreductase, beta subunit [Thermofilum pendens Hrk 5]